jgi:hypothetical protein
MSFPGVDVMITIFGEKMAFFLNTNVMINFFQNLALFWVKNANFFATFFRRKYFKNHNIGPWTSTTIWRKDGVSNKKKLSNKKLSNKKIVEQKNCRTKKLSNKKIVKQKNLWNKWSVHKCLPLFAPRSKSICGFFPPHINLRMSWRLPSGPRRCPVWPGANPTTSGANPMTSGANPTTSGANPTIVSYNASAVKIYNATSTF